MQDCLTGNKEDVWMPIYKARMLASSAELKIWIIQGLFSIHAIVSIW